MNSELMYLTIAIITKINVLMFNKHVQFVFFAFHKFKDLSNHHLIVMKY